MEKDKTIRTFIAIELPAKIIDGLKEIQDELKDGTNKVTWVKPENIHLTIKFLGDIEADKIDSIVGLLEGAAAKSRSFDISAKGVGCFPTIDNPRVLWVGIEEGNVNMAALYNNIEDALSAIGFAKEERPFKPHLTLGRIKFLKDKKGLKERIERFKDITLGQYMVDSICLFQSRLTPEGAVHIKLEKIELTHKKYRLQKE
ncbi:MAG: RNA 2',3'-cyclic phosphodiesterase [Deltaproteobacteria bacterium]